MTNGVSATAYSSSSSSSSSSSFVAAAVAGTTPSETTTTTTTTASSDSTTLKSSTSSSSSGQQQQQQQQQLQQRRLFFRPRDIAYDEAAREALQTLRNNDKDKDTNEAQKTELYGCGDDSHVTLTLIGYKGGRIPDQINQDRAVIVHDNTLMDDDEGDDDNSSPSSFSSPVLLLGVFDGHGRMGEVVSEHVVTELPNMILSSLSTPTKTTTSSSSSSSRNDDDDDDDNDIISLLKKSFITLNETVPTKGIGGCTASVVLFVGSKAYVANAGDSQSMIASYHPDTDQVQLLYVTREDKPHLPSERRRIEAMGGQVYIPSNLDYESSRVISGHTGLAMSRSIGDWDMTGVIAEPLVHVLDLTKTMLQYTAEDTGDDDTTEVVVDETCTTPVSKDDDDNDNSESIRHDETTTTTTTTTTITSSQSTDPTCRSSISEQQQQQPLQKPHFFAVSATDGMLDYVSPETLVEAFATAFYRRNVKAEAEAAHPLTVAQELILTAAKGWTKEMGANQYRDDIAVAAAKLVL